LTEITLNRTEFKTDSKFVKEQYWKQGSIENDLVLWRHKTDSGQSDHFMAYKGQNKEDAVKSGLNRIQEYVNEAQKWAEKGDKNAEKYYLGRALHVIQDSYAPSHVLRDPISNKIKSVQVYEEQNKKEHEKGDDIYIRDKSGKEVGLRNEAKKSIDAGTAFLNEYLDKRAKGEKFNVNKSSFKENHFKIE